MKADLNIYTDVTSFLMKWNTELFICSFNLSACQLYSRQIGFTSYSFAPTIILPIGWFLWSFKNVFCTKNEIPEYALCNPWKSKIKPDLKWAYLPFKAASPCTSRLLLDLLDVLEVIGFCVKLKFKISWWGYSVVMTAGLSLWPNSSFKWKNLRFTLLNGAQSGQKCAFHLFIYFFNIHRLQIDLPRSDHQPWVLPSILECLKDSIHRTAWVCWVCHCARMSFGPHQHNHHLAHEFCLFVVLSSSSKYN